SYPNSCQDVFASECFDLREAEPEYLGQNLLRMLPQQGSRREGDGRRAVDPEGRGVVDALAHFGVQQCHPMPPMPELRVFIDDVRGGSDDTGRHARALQRGHQILGIPIATDGGNTLLDLVPPRPAAGGTGELRRTREGRIAQDRAEGGPGFILPSGNRDPTVFAQAAEYTMGRARPSLVAGALSDTVVGAAVDHRRPEQGDRRLGLRHIDVLSLAGPSPVAARRQYGQGRVAWVRDVVGEIRARTGRLAVRKAGEELQPGQRAHGEAISEILVLGPGSTLHRHRDVDDILPDLPNRLVPEPEFLHGTRGEVVGDDIA